MRATPDLQLQPAVHSERWPQRVIARPEAIRPLPPHARPLVDLTYEAGGARLTVDDFMTRTRAVGLLILKGGEVALELYGPRHGPERRWHTYSVAKSITATLVGAALYEGAIQSLDDPCDRYLPRLRGSAYEGVTIRNALRMCSGVAWREDYDGQNDHARLQEAISSRRAGAMLDLARTLPRTSPQGSTFAYNSVESCVLGALVAAATGRPLADYCADKVWGPAGAEADGLWALESDDGLEFGGLGVSARLRDFGRFGQFILEDGVGVRGDRVLPPGWRDLAAQPDCDATGFGRLTPDSPAGYGYHWWAVPRSPANVQGGAFSAIGAFGQRVYVNPAEQVVIAIQSAWPTHLDLDADLETIALVRAAVIALREG